MIKLDSIKIGTLLRMGLGIILVLVVLLGLLSWRATDHIWRQTKTFYDHPYQVRRAIGKLEAKIETISMYVRNLFLFSSEQEFSETLNLIENEKYDIQLQLVILTDKYLGLKEDIVNLQCELAKWNAIRDETIWLLRMGKRDEAIARIKYGGIQHKHALAVRKAMMNIEQFAIKKGEELYLNSSLQKEILNQQLLFFVSAILSVCLIISWFLLKGIKDPLRKLTNVAEQFTQGNLDSRSSYTAENEIGELSKAFNLLAKTVATEIRINKKSSLIADIMLKEIKAQSFCRELIKALIEHTSSQLGAVYLLNQHTSEFVHFESVGLKVSSHVSFSSKCLEGEFGMALSTGKIERITNIPEDTHFTFSTVSGELKPREIITIPLYGEKEVVAIISLASVTNYNDNDILLLNRIFDTIKARMNGVLAFMQIQELAEKLRHQNAELEAQKKELNYQADELMEINSELEMQKQQLDDANRLKSTFLSTMSHELRTPLNSVIVLSGVLKRRLTKTNFEEELDYLEVIERNGKNLLALINDILDLSRIEAGREEINVSKFSLTEIVKYVVDMIAPQAEEKNIALVNKLEDVSDEDVSNMNEQAKTTLPLITSDPEKCRHILQNLIYNGVKFTESGRVEVSAQTAEEHILISISDTGIGIAEDELSHIFDEFYQADDSSSRKYGGTGLGLAIAKKYALLLQGDIAVKSTKGEGSVFTLRLPISISNLEDETDGENINNINKLERYDRNSTNSQQYANLFYDASSDNKDSEDYARTILLVDDSEPAIIQMNDILSEQGYKILIARSGQEALHQVEESSPNAVILDIMMPQMDGFEVLKKIRSSDKTISLPVLILTAKHLSNQELSVLKGNNVHQLIQKGDVSRDELLRAVNNIFAGKSERQKKSYKSSTIYANKSSYISANISSKTDSAEELLTEHIVDKISDDNQQKDDKPTLNFKDWDRLPVILVVEDNPDNMQTMRAILKDILNDTPYTIIEATDGLTGVERAKKHIPDIILMDIALPIMDGFAALEKIREDDNLHHIPVVAVTASAMKGDKDEILDYGFDKYISKPIDAELLKKTLSEVLNEKQYTE